MTHSNYELMKRQMQAHFLEFDQNTMIRRFHLKHDEEYLYLRFVGRMYRVNRHTGLVEWADGDVHEADYNEAMSIYDVLCCSREGCCLSGEFVPIDNLSGVMTARHSESGLFDNSTKFFGGKADQLGAACERLGGIPAGRADVGYQLQIFDFMPVRLAFWDEDDEFPAVLKLMWDLNLLDYIHYETSFFIAGHLLKRLQEIMQAL